MSDQLSESLNLFSPQVGVEQTFHDLLGDKVPEVMRQRPVDVFTYDPLSVLYTPVDDTEHWPSEDPSFDGLVIGVTTRRFRKGEEEICWSPSAYHRFAQSTISSLGLQQSIRVGLINQRGETDDEVRRSAEEVSSIVDAVLFTGGPDIGPEHYNEDQDPEAVVDIMLTDRSRDVFEFSLLEAIDARAEDEGVDIPRLFICRGAQLLWVYRGGSMIQDIAHNNDVPGGHLNFDSEPDQVAHPISVVPDTLLSKINDGKNTAEVNSQHHQAMQGISSLVEGAHAPDGVIEAIENEDYFEVGVQWHPEMFPSALSENLSKWLVKSTCELNSLDINSYRAA